MVGGRQVEKRGKYNKWLAMQCLAVAEERKNIGFYGEIRRRMQNKHNSVTRFYWIAGALSCHKGHKMAVLFISVSPRLLRNDVSEVFELRHYAAVMRLSPPPHGSRYGVGGGGGGCCFYFLPPTKILITFYIYTTIYIL